MYEPAKPSAKFTNELYLFWQKDNHKYFYKYSIYCHFPNCRGDEIFINVVTVSLPLCLQIFAWRRSYDVLFWNIFHELLTSDVVYAKCFFKWTRTDYQKHYLNLSHEDIETAGDPYAVGLINRTITSK